MTSHSNSDKRRVLAIGDSRGDLAPLLKSLRDLVDVYWVSNSGEAAELLRNERFDLLLGGPDDLGALAARTTSSDAAPVETSELRRKIDAIDRAGRELVSLNADEMAEMDVHDRLKFLEDKIIDVCRQILHFDHFAVLLVDQKTNQLETLLASGITEADALRIYAKAEGNGVSGYVAATGESYLCDDVMEDARYLPGLKGARSSLTVPLSLHDRVIGVLNVESEKVGAFDDEDLQYAEIFGRNVALALHMLQLMIVERHATTEQLAADVDASLAEPLNRIIAETSRLLVEHPDDAALRERLRSILDDVDRVKLAMQEIASPAPIRGLLPDDVAVDNELSGKRVLIADDEEVIRETVSDVLTKLGALTVMASDGAEAVTMIASQHFDLVLSDIKMPHRNGYEVFSAVRTADAGCPVVLITGFGYDPDHSIVCASREGLTGVLFKPFKVDQMLDVVRKALSGGECGS